MRGILHIFISVIHQNFFGDVKKKFFFIFFLIFQKKIRMRQTDILSIVVLILMVALLIVVPLYYDGVIPQYGASSNTSGFQRTALVAINGALPNGGSIETICIEEEAAQRVKDDIFSLDRLGIPLVEITTSPCMHTPEDVQQVAEYIGMVLRSNGAVKRGLGTIRQDVNISIRDGARVEIKGVQDLALIAEVNSQGSPATAGVCLPSMRS